MDMNGDFNVISRGKGDVLHNGLTKNYGGTPKMFYQQGLGNQTPYGVSLHDSVTSGGALDRPQPMTPPGMKMVDWVRNRQRPAIEQ